MKTIMFWSAVITVFISLCVVKTGFIYDVMFAIAVIIKLLPVFVYGLCIGVCCLLLYWFVIAIITS